VKLLFQFHGNPNFVVVFTRGLQWSVAFSHINKFNTSTCYMSNIRFNNISTQRLIIYRGFSHEILQSKFSNSNFYLTNILHVQSISPFLKSLGDILPDETP
jgi:hypothetical protein